MRRVTTSMKAVAASPWLTSLLGTAVMAFGFWRIYQHPAGVEDTKLHMAFDGGTVALGLLILPGVASQIASNARALVGVYATFRAAKKDGGKEDRESGAGGAGQ